MHSVSYFMSPSDLRNLIGPTQSHQFVDTRNWPARVA